MLHSQGIIQIEEDSDDNMMDESMFTDEKQSLMDEDIREIILCDTATDPEYVTQSVHSLVQQREYSKGRSIHPTNRFMDYTSVSPLGRKAQRHISHRYIPNKSRLLKQHHDGVFCSLFNGNGDMFMSACKDQIITIYDTTTWEVQKSIHARDIGWSIISTDFSPDGRWLIYSSWSDYVHIINTTGDYETHESLDMKPEYGRFCLFSTRFSPDSREVLGGSSDGHVYIYDLDRRERIERVF